MLAFLASSLPAPVDEPRDRDPGILTLAAALLHAWQRRFGNARSVVSASSHQKNRFPLFGMTL